MSVSERERRRRWRLVLGAAVDPTADDPTADDRAAGVDEIDVGLDGRGVTAAPLHGRDVRVDAALGALYDRRPESRGRGRAGGLGRSAPAVARWLGDIRRYFPTSVVQVMQRDAIDRLELRQLLLEPEMLGAVEPDVHLVALLVELNSVLPDETRASARVVVARVVADLERRLAERTRLAVDGALSRWQRTRRPRPTDIDWHRTIAANLRHYLPEQRTVVPERVVGGSRLRRGVARDVIVAVDQSASMGESIVHASVVAAALASIPALRTRLVAFDTAVADLTHLLHDPVDVVFGVQLGGGTDIAAALAYCERLVEAPEQTIVVLVSDLYEGGSSALLLERVERLVGAGVQVLVLLSLSDTGAPSYDRTMATAFAERGVVSIACTPDAFPDLFAAALERRDLSRWADDNGLHTAAPSR